MAATRMFSVGTSGGQLTFVCSRRTSGQSIVQEAPKYCGSLHSCQMQGALLTPSWHGSVCSSSASPIVVTAVQATATSSRQGASLTIQRLASRDWKRYIGAPPSSFSRR